jgi:hypothetical protein
MQTEGPESFAGPFPKDIQIEHTRVVRPFRFAVKGSTG